MPTKRSDGRWQSKFTYNGKQYTVYASKKGDISDAVTKKKEELKSGKLEHDNPALDKYYEIFSEYHRTKVRSATIRSQTMQYNACANVMVSGTRLGDMRIRDIKPKDIRQVQRALADSGKSTRTVNDYMSHLSQVFKEAVKDETVDRNPCLSVAPLKRTELPARETKHRALTKAEAMSFLEAAEGSYYYNAFRFMLCTGMRIGEVAALSRSDITKKYIRVDKTITRDENGAYIIGAFPKTDAGRRNIPMTNTISEVIKAQKRHNTEWFGLSFDNNALLFPGAEGGIMRDYSIDREIKRITTKLGMEYFTCHALRATFATRWIEQKPEDFKVLSEILGHADIKITLNLYTHVTEEKKTEVMDKISFI